MMKKCKKPISVLLSILMVLSVFGGTAFTASAAEKELTALEEGSFLGELGLITGSERSAAAVALENTELLKITDEELAEYFVANPGKIIRVMKQMAARLQDLTDDYMEACRTISEMDHYDADADEEEQIPGLMERITRFTEIFKKNR